MSRFIDERSVGVAFLILIASSVVGLVYNSVYSKGIPLLRRRLEVGDTLAATPDKGQPGTQVISRAISVSEAYEHYSSGETVFIDSRSRADYEEKRIPGSISLPEADFNNAYLFATRFVTPQTHIIVYCQGRECDESIIVQESLMEMGYNHVDVLLGGMPEWLDAGYPTDSGPVPGEER
jgi:rhodanese-related sulfurtransferase